MNDPSASTSNNQDIIPPGSWLGMLGGGQLGRMFTHSAQRMGYHVGVFETEENCPAGQAADAHFMPSEALKAESVVCDMAQKCSAVSLEFENIDSSLVRLAAQDTLTHPKAEFLEMSQNRILEKTGLAESGFPTTPFVAVDSEEAVHAAAEELNWPLVLKTATSGYDGKGQVIVRTAEELPVAWAKLGASGIIAEKWIDFQAEVSMITARNLRGEIECFPLFENDHKNHILFLTLCPCTAELAHLEAKAQEICRGIAETFGVIGLFCVEFFVSKSGELLINEIAPRPHNSGHITMDAVNASQFEQQVRAICNLPLAKTELIRPGAMINLLGDVWQGGAPDWSQVLRHENAFLHLYGKAEARVGRKMGHINVLAESSTAAAQLATQIHQDLQS
ncbi:MAG: 5-(carboxyamino)imidazole ribonucleotide synthase [Planctomycetota bacterium]